MSALAEIPILAYLTMLKMLHQKNLEHWGRHLMKGGNTAGFFYVPQAYILHLLESCKFSKRMFSRAILNSAG